MRDHGGNLDWAMQTYGGTNWIDLSTGINRVPYPVPPLSPGAWTQLPTRTEMARLLAAAGANFGTEAPIVALPGAQAAIQLIPHLRKPGRARVLGPTYNEHAAALRAAGWQVEEVRHLADLPGADLAVFCNPNNPDGRQTSRRDIMNLVGKVGLLVVDESFIDATPSASSCPDADTPGLLILRSFGKFYGLAGLRLGFALGAAKLIDQLAEMAGPWPVSGAAIAVGTKALLDVAWSKATIDRLNRDVMALDGAAQSFSGWSIEGGTALFRLYEVENAAATQDHFARHQIWTRIFPWSKTLIRFGLPGPDEDNGRLWQAFESHPE